MRPRVFVRETACVSMTPVRYRAGVPPCESTLCSLRSLFHLPGIFNEGKNTPCICCAVALKKKKKKSSS